LATFNVVVGGRDAPNTADRRKSQLLDKLAGESVITDGMRRPVSTGMH